MVAWTPVVPPVVNALVVIAEAINLQFAAPTPKEAYKAVGFNFLAEILPANAPTPVRRIAPAANKNFLFIKNGLI